MTDDKTGGSDHYVVRERALPEALRKAAKVKHLLDMNPHMTSQEAAEQVGISRSSFYKYKDDVYPFYDNTKGKTVTLVVQEMDELGFLSKLCSKISAYRANILTLHQSIPVNGIATITVSVEIREDTSDIMELIREIEAFPNVQYVKILAQEQTPG